MFITIRPLPNWGAGVFYVTPAAIDVSLGRMKQKQVPTTRDDAERVRAAQSGDRQAFAELVRIHWKTAHGLAYASLRDVSMAEDVAQEAFVAAWSRLSDLRNPKSFPMWLRKITRNLASNANRAEAYRRQLHERYTVETERSGERERQPDSAAQSDERHRVLEDLLAELPASTGEVMTLHYYHGLSVREIAERLGISVSAAKKRLERGRDRLRVKLESGWRADTGNTVSRDREAQATRQIMGMLALGPVAPDLAREASATGINLIVHKAQQSGAISACKTAISGGLFMTNKQITALAALVLIGVASLYAAFNGGSTAPSDPAVFDDELGIVAEEKVSEAAAMAENDSSSDSDTGDQSAASPTATVSVIGTNAIQRNRIEPVASEEIVLPASVAGVVVDRWNAPVADANVVIVATGWVNDREKEQDSLGLLLSDLNKRYVTKSDSKGRFRVGGIEYPGVTSGYAFGEGFSGTMQRISLAHGEDRTDLKIVVRDGIPLWGRIVDTSGRAVAGAHIQTVAYTSGTSSRGGLFEYSITDDQGRFELLYEKSGVAILKGIHPLKGQRIFEAVSTGTGEEIQLIWKEAAALSGTVIYADGSPAAGAEAVLTANVRLTSGQSEASSGSTVMARGHAHTALIDEEGRYRFDDLDADATYQASVRTLTYAPLSQPEEIPALRAGYESRWDCRILEEIVVHGTVRTAMTRRPAEATIYVLQNGEAIQGAEADSAEDGTFRLAFHGAPGQFTIAPIHKHMPWGRRIPGYDVHMSLQPGVESEIVLSIADPYSIRLRAVNSDGQPIPNVRISLNWITDRAAWGSGTIGTTDAEGRFEQHGFAPTGSYQLYLEAEGYLRESTRYFEAASGALLPEETIMLYRPANIEGWAFGPDGDPLSYVDLEYKTYTPERSFGIGTTVTGEDGYFLIEDQRETTVDMWVRTPPIEVDTDFRLRWEQSRVTLDAQQVTSLGAIVLTQTSE